MESDTLAENSIFTKKIDLPYFTETTNYQLANAVLLAMVPLACGILLLMLMTVFSRLNLYFLEANGLVLNSDVRDAYLQEVAMEMFSVGGYLLLQILITGIVAFLVMRWATAPFRGAKKLITTAMNQPDALRPPSRWLSECPAFDRIVWFFALRVKGGGENQAKRPLPFSQINLQFFIKFLLAFGVLSVSTGYVLSIIMNSGYQRIVELSLQLINNTASSSHYFIAQQDILRDATTLTIGFSLICYLFIGWRISHYMATMLHAFSRSLCDEKFPIQLRHDDLYHDLAETLNAAQRKLH
jgi:hypothetical protein